MSFARAKGISKRSTADRQDRAHDDAGMVLKVASNEIVAVSKTTFTVGIGGKKEPCGFDTTRADHEEVGMDLEFGTTERFDPSSAHFSRARVRYESGYVSAEDDVDRRCGVELRTVYQGKVGFRCELGVKGREGTRIEGRRRR